MTYIEYLNRFNQWLEEDSPTDKAVILYYAMLNMFNRRGWPRWAGVDTQKLMRMCRTTSNNTAYRARDCLVSAGFLEYRPGKKGKATEYGLCAKYYTRNCTENGTESSTENGTESGTENGTPNKTKDKDLISGGGSIARAMYDQSLADLMAYYEDNTGSAAPRSVGQAIFQWRERMPDDLIRAAIDTAAKAGKSWNYAEGCLKRWERDGIRTLAALQAAEAARQRPPTPAQRRKTAQDEFLAIARGEIP